MPGTCRGDEDVLFFEEFGERRQSAEPRMILLEDAHMLAGEQFLPLDAGDKQREFADREIDLAGLERGVQVLQSDLGRPQSHIGR